MKLLLSLFQKMLAVCIVNLLLQSCEPSNSSPSPAIPDVSGSWTLTTTVSENDCGIPVGLVETEVIYLIQLGADLEILNFNGNWGTGWATQDDLQFTGSEETLDFGCLAVTMTSGVGDLYGNTITGSFITDVQFEPMSCAGYSDCSINTDFVMTHLPDTGCLDRAVFNPPDESQYILPYPVDDSFEVYQSYCWPTGGHRDQLAYDFTIPIGHPITASRAGTVRLVKEDSPDNGIGVGEHNFVHIEHSDGTTGFYAHLMQFGILVTVGGQVVQGQIIGYSGNSGESGSPHLHFGVYRAYPPTEGDDIPVNFRNADGPLDDRGGLIRGEFYMALPY